MKRKYNLNCDYFNSIDTHEKAYILGFLAADGYNNNKDGEVVIGQAGIDNKEILLKIREELDSNQPLFCIKRENNCNDFYTLSIYSRVISNKLSDLGIVQNKSHILKYPTINKDLDSSFILGYFDGDGSVNIDYKRYNRGSLSFTGNKDIIDVIQEKIKEKTNYNGYRYIRHKNSPNILSLNYCGSKSTTKILSWLYSKSTLFLERKHEKYSFLNEIQNFKEKNKELKLMEDTNKNLAEKEEKNKEYNNIIELLNKGYSIRQLKLQFGIDKRKTQKIIKELNYEYPKRRRMYSKDPRTHNNF
jgi:hypothetical protein